MAGNENNPTNTPDPRALDCIYLDYIDGPQGGHKLLHLATGSRRLLAGICGRFH